MGSKFGDYEPDFNSWHDGVRYADGEYQVWIDGNLIGYGKTYAQALAIQSNANAARADHRHITYDDLQVMRAAGTFGGYLAGCDDDGLAAVAHMLVSANHAAGRLVEYAQVLGSLAGIRAAAQAQAAGENSQPAQVLIVAEYADAVEQIIIRRGYRGEVLHFCDTWTQAQEYMQSIGAR